VSETVPNGKGLRIAIVVSRFNSAITERLLGGAKRALERAGVPSERMFVETVPGAFELPLAAKLAAASNRFDAVIALGAVIRGETDHYVYVCEAATHGLLRASLDTGIPVAFGVLTTDTEAQALARAGDALDGEHANKGADCAHAAIEMVHKLRRLRG
jgi:6,7-dimethyl-8-ribityllumazine synthase